MKCFRCGNELTQTSRFCAHCGVRVSDPDAETLDVPHPAPEDLLERMSLVFSGEYQIEREVARGGMGIVLEARERDLGRSVALKILPPELGLTARAVERFRREAQTVAELDHRNVVPVYRMGQTGGVFFIAMKFIQGRSLETILTDQGPLPAPVAIHILRQAAAGLAYAHQHKVVHRDVKSANLLVEVDGRVLVSDFGVALRTTDVTLTSDGAVIGSPPFMSPEQCAGFRAGPQSDQYSLGVVAFQMLAGAVPFYSETVAGYIQHHMHSPLPDLGAVRQDLPTELVGVVRRMLAKNPDDRFESTDQLLATVEALPFSGADRAMSSDVLRRLARGDEVERVRATPLPLLTELPTLVLTPEPAGARGRPGRPGRLGRSGRSGVLRVVAAIAAVIVLVLWAANRSGGLVVGGAEADPPALPAAKPLVASAPESRLPPAVTGRIRMLTRPANAVITIDGRVAGVGKVFDVAVTAGPHRVRATATGFGVLDTTVVVPRDAILSLGRVALPPSHPAK